MKRKPTPKPKIWHGCAFKSGDIPGSLYTRLFKTKRERDRYMIDTNYDIKLTATVAAEVRK